MSTSSSVRKTAALAMALSVIAPIASTLAPAPSAHAANFVDPGFSAVWDRTDLPVQNRMAARSWTWGPEPFYAGYEPYAQGPGGQHLVQYLDKSRMEINDPTADRGSQWFVTNGLLVVDMIAGKIQAGDQQFIPVQRANIPVAGDANGSPETPTYASLAKLASVDLPNRAANRTGQQVREGLGRNGNISNLDNLANLARYSTYEPTTGHNIADVFWSFLNQRGVVYENGQYGNGTIVNWLFAMGYPISEPYWIKIRVSGEDRWVLMQAFQRRVLTYSPYNPEGWKVEMANVGRAYYDWKNTQIGPVPTPTATPKPATAASITINPASGDTSTQINVVGRNFPAFAAVTVGVEKPSANYFRTLATVPVKGDGTFGAKITVPTDAARLGEVTITAAANGGAVRATQQFRLDYSPRIEVTPAEVVVNGLLRVQGDGFPANQNVNIGVQFTDKPLEWISRTRSGSDGSFDAQLAIGNRPVGGVFKVIAMSDGGFKASTASTLRVLAQPALQAEPASGPAGTSVTLRGSRWPANRAITVSLRPAGGNAETILPNQVVADAAGNFAIAIYVGPQYANESEVRLIASEATSKLRLDTAYRIVGPPREANVVANPSVVTTGQVIAVSGNNWQAGALIQIGVGRPGYGVEEWLAAARGDGNRNFATNVILGARWQNAGQLVLTAAIPNGKIATTNITVVGTTGRIVPSGMPMTVNLYTDKAGQKLYKLNAQGWLPGSSISISVVSADGAVNVPVATASVNANGIFSASFYAIAPWAGRSDLGIRAQTLDGGQYSLRYAPTSSLVKISGNTYTVSGFNWAANSRIDVVEYDREGKSNGDAVVERTITADANGAFSFTIDLPRTPGNNKIDFELRSKDQPYSATFDY